MAMYCKNTSIIAAAALLALGLHTAAARAFDQPFTRKPDATVDLRTSQGVRLVGGSWRYSDARIVEVDSRGPGADLKASGAPVHTYDITPHAGAADFDDSAWEPVRAEDLEARRAGGRLSFGWYRIDLVVPDKIGNLPTKGSTIVFEIVVDDYAEVWVDGKLPRELGEAGHGFVGGFNVPNRVVVARDVQPGRHIRLAVFGANGPLSDPPANFIWVRSAALDFYAPDHAQIGRPVTADVERLDPALDGILGARPVVEQLADGFGFTEGPVWAPPVDGREDSGSLLFSDPNENTIYRWSERDGVEVVRVKSGYAGVDIGEYGQPGSNGLTFDREGRLTVCEHGRRRVVRIEKNGTVTVLADRYDGKRLNSPNDLVYKSDGSLYFTDPAFGLPKWDADPRREQPHLGVYRVADGNVELLVSDLSGPNGIAFSPDERYLYVTNWDPQRKVVMRYDVGAHGGLSGGRVFYDMAGAVGDEALDGVKVDRLGNLFVSGPGGIWILSPEGKHLGTVALPQLPANFAWGDADGKTLYMTARTGLYRMRVATGGDAPSRADAVAAR